MEIDLVTLIAQILNFLLLLWVLKKLLYKPLLTAMANRKKDIIKAIEDAEKKQEEALGLKEENEKMLEDIRKQKNELLRKAEEEIGIEKTEMSQKLREEQEAERVEFKEQLEIEKQRFIKEVNKVVANKFAKFSKTVFSDLSNTDIEAQAIEVFLNKIKDLKKAEIEKINTSAKAHNGEITIATSHDLSKKTADKIKDSIKKIGVNYTKIKFEKDSEIILGVNLKADSYIIAWDLKEFLNSFKEELTKILK
jgi:F-type H+-transporting ATPase subunit b